MGKVMTRIGITAIVFGSGLGLSIGAIPAGAATAQPATATNCSWVGTNYNRLGPDPHFFGFQATCNDTPTGEWRLDLNCTSYGGKTVTAYGSVVTGNGSSNATCPGQNYEVDGIYIENLQ